VFFESEWSQNGLKLKMSLNVAFYDISVDVNTVFRP